MLLRICVLLVLPFFFSGLVSARETATTSTGRTVVLNPDGTWQVAPSATASAANSNFRRGPTATAKLELGQTGHTFYFDPDKWYVSNEHPGRIEFQHVDADRYAMIIYERIRVPMRNLIEVAFRNAKAAAPNAKILSQSTANLNGFEVMLADLSGTVDGIDLIYHNLYYSSRRGTVQILSFTGSELFTEFKPDLNTFLSGFEPAP